MGQKIFSPYWYRVAELKPRLNGHVQMYRHLYRGQRWYLLSNSASGTHHRFNSAAYQFIGRLDGKRTVKEIWEASQGTLGDQAPTQDEVIELMGRLHARDLLRSDAAIDTLELFQRQKKQQEQWKQGFSSPLAIRFPLVSPDRFFKKYSFLVIPFASRIAICLWCLVVGSGVVLAALHWPDLTHDMADRVLTPSNLFYIWMIFPLVKLFHELSHAFAIRLHGGEVTEMGIMLLAFTPIPYVEASASASFPNKWDRMAVAAAGVATELFIAVLALFLWLNVESGIVSSLCYNVMLIGGVSTLLFNGNPLLRFDGYYIFADLLEIPNLAQRSRQYLTYLFQRYILRLQGAELRPTAKGEKVWFVVYGVCSSLYKILVIVGLILLVSSKFFFIGSILAIWAVVVMLVLPGFRSFLHVLDMSSRYGQRRRLVFTALLPLSALLIFLLCIPVPLHTQAEGVVWVDENSQVRAGTDCFIKQVLVEANSKVQKNEKLLLCVDPFLESELGELRAGVLELQAFQQAEPLRNSVQRDIWKSKIRTVQAKLDRTRERKEQLIVRSPGNGLFVLPEVQNLPGRYVKQGTMLGYILGGSASVIKVVVPQTDISLIRQRNSKVELRRVGSRELVETTTISRETPAAGYQLPSPALGTTGGGLIAVDPADPEGTRSLDRVFVLDISLPKTEAPNLLGQRVYVRFSLGREPIIGQWYRKLRRLFLRRFHV